ncbi:MAG: winged helix-turn-helix transcriptional regulator [Chloroflexota bacterium]|nr:winged helix-turn-helix transcriptional regulator [Chloroflexota bacterium]
MEQRRPEWTVFSNHGTVLFYVATNPDATLRQISDAVGITERQVGRIVRNLAEAGMVRIERLGRRNLYAFNPEARLRHPTLAHVPLGPIIAAIASAPKPMG